MKTSRREIGAVLDNQGGVIARRQHPDLATAIAWLHRRGELVSVLPGVYAEPSAAGERTVRLRAAMLWAPDAVLTGRVAASVSFWPGIRFDRITLASWRHRAAPHGFSVCRRSIPADLIEERSGVRFTSPALTALDLCDELGGDGIDTALRTRAATLDGMRAAMNRTTGRAGNHHRRELLLDSRDEPWSAAERVIHRLLRAAGITGWKANLAVPTLGSVYYLDVGFERQLLAVEIDGRLHETDRGIFESDRWRQNQLVLQGWRVLRFTWSMLTQHPELVIQAIRQALALKK
jgi:very-short-patch-repair endonuclease